MTPANISIPIEVADTPAEQEQGLSGRMSLDGGMLFVFQSPDRYGFWMKDMAFPIDIVWMDAERRVIAVDANVSPDSYPKTYYPPSDAMYVLELNAGQAEVLGIRTDQSLRW